MTTQTIAQPLIFLPRFPKINLRFFWILSLISIIGLLTFYIFQVNTMTKEIYFLEDYKKNLTILERENETLEINSAQLSSLGNIDGLINELNFKKAGKIKYIHLIESSVAAK